MNEQGPPLEDVPEVVFQTRKRFSVVWVIPVVAALIGTNPLFSLLISWIMLRDSEKLSWRVTAGCLVIVAGAAVVTLF